MSQQPSSEAPLLPTHESPVRRIMSDARGIPYHPLMNVTEARLAPDGAVIFEGDYGGIIYLTCPATMVRCSENELRQLLVDVDALAFNYPPSARVYFERLKPGAGVWGGMGGGVFADGLWMHPRLQPAGMDAEIVAVLSGESSRLPFSTEQLVRRAMAARPEDSGWPLLLARLHEKQMSKTTGEHRKRLAGQALGEYELMLRLNPKAESDLSRLTDMAHVAVEAEEVAKADDYANRALRAAWQHIARGTRWFSLWGRIVHRSSIALGRVALRQQDIEAAATHLLEAGKAPWSIQSEFERPDMTLARELLDRNQRGSVLEYLSLCERIWPGGLEQLQRWVEIVRSGGIPDLEF